MGSWTGLFEAFQSVETGLLYLLRKVFLIEQFVRNRT